MPKYHVIKSEVLKCIDGMPPNQRIWSRQAMCTKFSASRSTIDKVMQDLSRDGLIYTLRGSGSFVAPREGQCPPPSSARYERAWGVIMPDVDFQTSPELFIGIDECARRLGVNLMLFRTGDDPLLEYKYIQMLVKAGAQGLIIVPAMGGQLNMNGYRLLTDRGIPFVFWNRSVDALPDVPQVCLNGYHGARIATRHLLDMGYRRVAYIAPARFRSSMDRFFGYGSALEDGGVGLDTDIVQLNLTDIGEAAARECLRALLRLKNPPDAFLCFTDEIAMHMCRALEAAGKRIPEDAGVMGFESMIRTVDAQMGDKKLSYVSLNAYQSGQRTARALDDLIHRKRVEMLMVTCPVLVIRDTCAKKARKETQT